MNGIESRQGRPRHRWIQAGLLLAALVLHGLLYALSPLLTRPAQTALSETVINLDMLAAVDAQAPAAPPAQIKPAPRPAIRPAPVPTAPGEMAVNTAPGPAAPSEPAQAEDTPPAPVAKAEPALEPAVPKSPSAWVQGDSTLAYDIFMNDSAGALARMVYELKIREGRYTLSTRGEAQGMATLFLSGLLTQTSEGTVGPEGFAPTRYAEKRGKRPEQVANIQRALGEVTFLHNNETRPIGAGGQDRLSVMYQLGALARAAYAAQGTLTAGQKWPMPVVMGNDVEPFAFEVEGQDTLSIGGKNMETWKVVRRLPEGSDGTRVDMWLSPSLAWVPVQLKLTDRKGQSITQTLSVAQP